MLTLLGVWHEGFKVVNQVPHTRCDSSRREHQDTLLVLPDDRNGFRGIRLVLKGICLTLALSCGVKTSLGLGHLLVDGGHLALADLAHGGQLD